MHKSEGRDPREGGGRLARRQNASPLARVVPQLSPEALHRVIARRGLDACDELVACATPAQLTSVLDLDLWRKTQPGVDEQFDAERFGEWLEMLAEMPATVAADTVAALDPDLVVIGLSRYIAVFDPATFLPTVPADELPDRDVKTADGVTSEMGGYFVRARTPDAWDAILALFVALEEHQPGHFHALMRGCRRLSNSTPEIDGLDDLLMAPEQLLHDVAIDRESRRAERGYMSSADARAFLQLARQAGHRVATKGAAINPVASAYFRDTRDEAAPADDEPIDPTDAGVVELLADAGLAPEQLRALIGGSPTEPARSIRLRELLEHLRLTNAIAYDRRSQELAFLTNVLMTGCSVQMRAFSAQEAFEAASGACNVGLELWPGRVADTFLLDQDLVTVFERGWTILHERVTGFVTHRLIATLETLQSTDIDVARGLDALRRTLVAGRAAGTPWRARPALDVIAMLDMPAWASLLGLLDECPVLPAALRATIDGHAGAVSATAFEFFSTTDHIAAVERFMEQLVDVLGG